MTQQIDLETFSHLVELASFEFEPEQTDYLRQQLNNQLKAISELAAITVDDDIPTSLHGVPYPTAICMSLREDTWLPDENREAILKEIPQFEDGYVIVPDIPHTTLE